MARSMQHSLSNDDVPAPSWRQRPRPVGFELSYRLEGDTLVIDSTRKVERIRLEAVEQIRFIHAPSNVSSKGFRTQLRLSDGRSFSFGNLSWRSLTDMERNDRGRGLHAERQWKHHARGRSHGLRPGADRPGRRAGAAAPARGPAPEPTLAGGSCGSRDAFEGRLFGQEHPWPGTRLGGVRRSRVRKRAACAAQRGAEPRPVGLESARCQSSRIGRP